MSTLIKKSTMSGINAMQVTKLNIPSSPYMTSIGLPKNDTLSYGKIEVLKHVEGFQNQVSTINDFDNGESASFQFDTNNVTFDSKMHMINSYTFNMNSLGTIGTGKHFKALLNITMFKALEKVEVL